MSPSPVCPNCGQWQWPIANEPEPDCFHECRRRGFVPIAPAKLDTIGRLQAGEVKLVSALEHLDQMLDDLASAQGMLAEDFATYEDLAYTMRELKAERHAIESCLDITRGRIKLRLAKGGGKS